MQRQHMHQKRIGAGADVIIPHLETARARRIGDHRTMVGEADEEPLVLLDIGRWIDRVDPVQDFGRVLVHEIDDVLVEARQEQIVEAVGPPAREARDMPLRAGSSAVLESSGANGRNRGIAEAGIFRAVADPVPEAVGIARIVIQQHGPGARAANQRGQPVGIGRIAPVLDQCPARYRLILTVDPPGQALEKDRVVEIDQRPTARHP